MAGFEPVTCEQNMRDVSHSMSTVNAVDLVNAKEF